MIEIKNITGNSLSVKELENLSTKEKKDYFQTMKKLFKEKFDSRVNILGEDENKNIEKKFYFKSSIFWESHLQYLEQLRQVIGLRQYGQKDPLSEFKKEAFMLFEGLLKKIKVDVIKILMNLNIVVSSNKEARAEKLEDKEKDFEKVGRNEKCPCGSGKKFKHCHGNV